MPLRTGWTADIGAGGRKLCATTVLSTAAKEKMPLMLAMKNLKEYVKSERYHSNSDELLMILKKSVLGTVALSRLSSAALDELQVTELCLGSLNNTADPRFPPTHYIQGSLESY